MQVTTSHFGAVYSGFPQYSHYFEVEAELNSHTARWPGGHIAENRIDVYDIATDPVFDPTYLYAENPERIRLSLADSVNEAAAVGQTLSVVVPTYRYEDDVALGEADLSSFLHRLDANTELAGATIRLELGSEYYASETLTADEYASMALRFAEVIDAFDSSNVTFETVLQIGKTRADNDTILSYFGDGHLELIDYLTAHMLPISLQNLYTATHGVQKVDRLDVLAQSLRDWENLAVSWGQDAPGTLMTAWAVGAATNDPSSVDLEFQDYGARGGVTTLALFSEALALGIEEAAAWGVGEAGLSSLGRVVDGSVELTHAGTVFSELRDSVVGLELVQRGDARNFDWDDGTEFGTVMFSGLGRLVFYAANGESLVSAVSHVGGRAEGFSAETAQIIEAKRISTEYEIGYTPQNNANDRLYERPIVESIALDSTTVALNNEWLSLQQTQEYQVQEITVTWRHDGSLLADELYGYEHADWFDGRDGDDQIFGNEGNDSLLGGLGFDLLVGGAGFDSLDGGEGGDVIFGDAWTTPTEEQLLFFGEDFFDIA